MREVKVGERFDFEGEFGVVRYVGTLEGQPDEKQVWVGVEWDREGRGKNDGCAFQKRYFTTKPNTASFIKMEKFVSGAPRRTFVEALQHRYNPKEKRVDPKEMYIYSHKMQKVKVQLVGQEKIFAKFCKLAELTKVNLKQLQIYSSGIEGEIAKTCPNVEELDLSSNLISDWGVVIEIIKQLPKLRVLNVSENRLASLKQLKISNTFENVKVLVLNKLGISWEEVECVKSLFPCLEELHLCENNICAIGNEKEAFVSGFDNLKLLNLTENRLNDWDQVWKLSKLKNLEKLMLNKNMISRIQYYNLNEEDEIPFKSLKSLSICNNQISEWDSINQLNVFPSLVELRILENPLQEKYGKMNVRQFVIARVKNLQLLNGSDVRPRERKDAEKYYLQQCTKEQLSQKQESPDFDKRHPRYKELVKEYGDYSELLKKASSNEQFSSFATVIVKHFAISGMDKDFQHPGNAQTKKRLQISMTVRMLKQMFERMWKIPASKQQLLYLPKGAAIPEPMDENKRPLSYYGVTDGGEIIMKEIDEKEEKEEEERRKKEFEARLKEQERDIQQQIEWQKQNRNLII